MMNKKPLIGDEATQACSTQEVLSFELFVQTRNNFQLHFEANWLGRLYRKQDAYCLCEKNSSDFCKLAMRLRRNAKHGLNNYLIELYEAYKMMQPYARSNWEIFT